MPKIKMSVKELQRISLILNRELKAKKSNIENLKKQEWAKEDRQEMQVQRSEEDLRFVELIKEKIDIELFGRNG